MTAKDKFISIFQKQVIREGSDKLLEYLLSKSSDFFTAPASTRFHGSYEGGLVEHSLHVYECLVDYLERERVKNTYNLLVDQESIAIIKLFVR